MLLQLKCLVFGYLVLRGHRARWPPKPPQANAQARRNLNKKITGIFTKHTGTHYTLVHSFVNPDTNSEITYHRSIFSHLNKRSSMIYIKSLTYMIKSKIKCNVFTYPTSNVGYSINVHHPNILQYLVTSRYKNKNRVALVKEACRPMCLKTSGTIRLELHCFLMYCLCWCAAVALCIWTKYGVKCDFHVITNIIHVDIFRI